MYALQKAIKDISDIVEVEVVDYQSPYLTEYYSLKKQSGRNIAIKKIKQIHFLLKRKSFSSFIHQYVKISEKQYNINNVSEINRDYDEIIVGSDQVWNPNLTKGDLNYFLPFLESKHGYSYAASVGLQEFPVQLRGTIKESLEKFKEISVREKSAKELIDGIVSNVVSHVDLDPTLLLTKKDWMNLCINKKKNRFILVYTVTYSKTIIEEALEFGRKKGLKVIYIGQYTNISGVKYVSCPSVNKLLSFFRDADYVFVNSFHGTVFSILFGKKFYSKLELKDGRNSRITDLLELCNLSNRVDLHEIDYAIDWEKVDEIINSERQKSISYLKRIVDNGNKQN